ncbi:MAG: LLM class flavin-dependent oxidoreductase [Candidatus Entotheonellia bacterium]
MRFYCFHLMPWAYLPEDFPQRYDSAWVTCPNSLYDPELGHPLYNRYLDELELADQLGFEGICVNEHHQNAYGNMPSPNIMAACLARRTRQAKLAVLGNVLPLYDHPQRIAEELAMLDVISAHPAQYDALRPARDAQAEGRQRGYAVARSCTLRRDRVRCIQEPLHGLL